MYKTLWNIINRRTTKHVTGFFLTALSIGWAVAGLLVGSLLCLAGDFTTLTRAAILFCSTGYSGLIFGFLGGIFHLYRTADVKKKILQSSTPYTFTQKAA